MNELSAEQSRIIGSALRPLAIIACAGSGKTSTALHRVDALRQLLDHPTHVALISFSNVAVDTFRSEYLKLGIGNQTGSGRCGLDIETMDGFITSNILRPHAYRTMQCERTPFLVNGTEPFLANFKVSVGNFPRPIGDLAVAIRDGKINFFCHYNDQHVVVSAESAAAVVKKLGLIGAYTHQLGRYWAYRTLREQPFILRAIARRFPQILVDEAQDIGQEHRAILELLMSAGSQISLVGDPNQAIYEFAGADGKFLKEYGTKQGVLSLELTKNYRSVPKILRVANALSLRADQAAREEPITMNGAFYTCFDKTKPEKVIALFRSVLARAEIPVSSSAILCRGQALVAKLQGGDQEQGRGITAVFVNAAIARDLKQRFQIAFELCLRALLSLLDGPKDLESRIQKLNPTYELADVRRQIWQFVRNPEEGLPSSSLLADTEWHPALIRNVKTLLCRLETVLRAKTLPNFGSRLSKAQLRHEPLLPSTRSTADVRLPIRIDTVHKAKGESINAVMYVAEKEHAKELLAGTNTEVGRIGYVALTRARDLFILAVPQKALPELRSSIDEQGFLALPIDEATAG